MTRPTPITPTPQRTDDRESDPEGDSGATEVDAGGRREREGRVFRPGPRPVDDGGIVVGHVNEIGTDRLHDDLVILVPDSLLRCRFQRARGDGELAQPLDGIHYVRLLREKSVADLFGPLQIPLHHSQRVREGHERLHAEVPVLMLQARRERVACECGVGPVFQPVGGLDDFERVGSGREDLRNERVRVKGDGSRQRVELCGAEWCCGAYEAILLSKTRCQSKRTNNNEPEYR